MSAQCGVDVAKVAVLEESECDDCGMPDRACECDMFDFDDRAGEPLTERAPAEDTPRSWEVLRRQLDAIEAERRSRA